MEKSVSVLVTEKYYARLFLETVRDAERFPGLVDPELEAVLMTAAHGYRERRNRESRLTGKPADSKTATPSSNLGSPANPEFGSARQEATVILDSIDESLKEGWINKPLFLLARVVRMLAETLDPVARCRDHSGNWPKASCPNCNRCLCGRKK